MAANAPDELFDRDHPPVALISAYVDSYEVTAREATGRRFVIVGYATTMRQAKQIGIGALDAAWGRYDRVEISHYGVVVATNGAV